MLPRCTLQLESATDADWREYIAKLGDAELWPVYEIACAESLKNGAYVAVFVEIRALLRNEMATRYSRVLAERDFAICELGKAKAQQRMETLRNYSPRRDQYAQ